MNIELSRRGFLRLAGAGVAATSLGAMGFGEAEAAEAAHVRAFKLTTTTETRNTCTYCSVACGIIMYSKGDVKAGEKADLLHIEGDADHPTNRGTLCPKGAALRDFVQAETRLTRPRYRAAGATEFQDISWDDALNKIARALKDDRDANLVQVNEAGVPVNRWTTTGFLAASATTNETAWLTYKAVRSMGIVGFDNQARV
ncbi:MAG TPA: twin-arginine translocation signal domain-containing protein [Paracoccus sp.]|jgi:formate dehydrogenase major subunit|nr:twin-arginine translocation signal domain-containing protein [Paracoccus sp. (in: a-proteobacteria)]|tara:strand:+ start:221 stop:820 length:600 start_codon:yes stop_codon:yes gene_type:complete